MPSTVSTWDGLDSGSLSRQSPSQVEKPSSSPSNPSSATPSQFWSIPSHGSGASGLTPRLSSSQSPSSAENPSPSRSPVAGPPSSSPPQPSPSPSPSPSAASRAELVRVTGPQIRRA